MGAIPDILEQLPDVPVYGTKLTLEIVKNDLTEDVNGNDDEIVGNNDTENSSEVESK